MCDSHVNAKADMLQLPDDLGDSGTKWSVRFERKGSSVGNLDVMLNFIVEPNVVMQGGRMHPGLALVEDENAEGLSEFEKEWIFLGVNEGGLVEATTDDEDCDLLRYRVVGKQ